jgi:DNA-binding MarR family transcriptional regulator
MAARNQSVKAVLDQPQTTGAETSELGVLEDLLGFRLRRSSARLSRGLSERLVNKGVRPGGFASLALIAANPGICQTDLARDIGSDKASVVSIIDELEGKGLAVRERSVTDRRRHALHITPAGKKMLREMTALARQTEAPMHEIMSETERAVFSELLDRIYNRFTDDLL